MAQASITDYFNTRKRAAADEANINSVKKVLLLDGDGGEEKKVIRNVIERTIIINNKPDVLGNDTDLKSAFVLENNEINSPAAIGGKRKIVCASRGRRNSSVAKSGNIEKLLNNMGRNKVAENVSCDNQDKAAEPVAPTKTVQDISTLERPVTPTRTVQDVLNLEEPVTPTKTVQDGSVTPTKNTGDTLEPNAPRKLNIMDKINLTGREPTFTELKNKMSRSRRLADLKASLARFKQKEKQLEEAEKRTQELKQSPSLKNFKALELEVNLSPQKPQSPVKAYLSPKKEIKARKNLFNVPSSPTKNALPMLTTSLKSVCAPAVKESLTLPYKYRCLAEIFRAIDTVSQIMHNRKETITFKKLKPAVEEMLKRNLNEKHLAQINYLYPEAYKYQREKLREFGTRKDNWELVVTPNTEEQTVTSEFLLQRRRRLFWILIEKVKVYHKEFLKTLDHPMEIDHEKIARWHPEFDIEKIPDIETSALPEPPHEEKFTTASEVLEKARAMFNCNTRMERALEKLKQSQETQTPLTPVNEGNSILKGIPKALLEKVRQRQAAKAFDTMTRSTSKEKEAQLYAKLPEVARLTRNLFVSEKKSVLPLELVLDKLCNSYRVFSNQKEMETYLKTIEKEVNGWLTFCDIRGNVYVKLSKGADLSLVVNQLKKLADQKLSS